MFGLLFVSSHVGLYLVIVLLFLCQQFIVLPCHLITCCVNSVLLRRHSLRMMVFSGLLTCADVCSFVWDYCSGKYTSFGTLGTVLRGLKTSRYFCLSVCVPLPSQIFIFLSVSFIFTFYMSLCPSSVISQNNTFYFLGLVFYTYHTPQSLCFELFLYFFCSHHLFSIPPVVSAQHYFEL